MRPGPDAVVFRKDRNYDAGRPCTSLHEVLHNGDNQPVVLSFHSLYLIPLIVFTACGHTQKPPNDQTDYAQLSNQKSSMCRSCPLISTHPSSRSFLLLSSNDLPNFVNHPTRCG